MTSSDIEEFESNIAEFFKNKKVRVPIHLSGGNLKQLEQIFEGIKHDDYVFSTHRNHAHYLFHTGDKEFLLRNILSANPMGSMHTIDRKNNFFSSGIVAGCVAIAAGVALALKMKGSTKKVWCFIGDGATDEGWFYEAFKYATCQDLPITYIIENNDRSVCTSFKDRWGSGKKCKVIDYTYTCTYPHAGIGEFVPL